MVEWRCARCGCTEPKTEILDRGVHYAKESCAQCGAYIRFVGKPAGQKPKREKSHTELVAQYGNGFCELCGIRQSKIPKNETMEAHHVIEYQHGGEKERENIWIICTRCHRLIHWTRTYLRHLAPGDFYAVDEDPSGVKTSSPVDQLEDDPPPW